MSTARASLPDDAPMARRVALAVVIGLHVLVLTMWQAPRMIRGSLPATTRTTISVALLPDVPAAPATSPPPMPSRPAPSAQAARRASPAPLHAQPLPDVPAPSSRAEDAAPSASLPAESIAASAAEAPSLLHSAATRRAISDAARRPSLAAQAGIDNHEPAMQNPDERLGNEIAKGATGDCAKGQYTGGGMGLLSLPFLAAAVLADKCR